MNSLRNQRWCLLRWLGVEFLSIFLCCIVSLPGEVRAHPLGNFSLNHYTAIELQSGELITRHVLDFAEIPSFNELANLDTDQNDLVTPEEISIYQNVIAKRFIDNATYSLGEGTGPAVLLQPKLLHAEIVLSQGQGALTCLQIQLSCAVQHPILTTEGKKRFFFQDQNDPHINGVREIRIKANPGVEIQADGIASRETSVPVSLKEDTFILTGLEASLDFSLVEKRDPPAERTLPDIFSLIDPRSIPVFPLKPGAEGNIKILKSPIRPNLEVQKEIAMLQPRAVISATGILSGNNSSATQTLSSTQNPSDPIASRSSAQDSEWASLIGQEELSPGIVFLAILVSIVAGASHALSPGHGKTVVAAYLVGSRGTVWHAIYLGLIVTMTHVSSVLLLGILILSFSQYVVPEKLYPWIEALSGLIIVIMGITLFFQRYGAFQRKRIMKSMGIFENHVHPHPHPHPHPHHSHSHPHPHEEENEFDVPGDQDEFHSHEEGDIGDHAHSHRYPHPHSHIHEGSTEFHAHHHEEDFSDHHHSDHDSDEDPGHSHSHSHDHSHFHSHDHDHDHDHEFSHSHSGHSHDHEHGPHTHTHEIPANASWWDLLILGVTGGMLPCPAAILVLLGAVALHRILFGMVLILFFSVGLATVLIGIGILMVTAKNLLNRIMKGEESFAWLQIVSPILVTILGIIIFVQGLRTGGIVTFHF